MTSLSSLRLPAVARVVDAFELGRLQFALGERKLRALLGRALNERIVM